MYYGLFTKVGHKFIRVDRTTGYTLDTAKRMFQPLIATLRESGLKAELRKLPPVKQINPYTADAKYARSEI